MSKERLEKIMNFSSLPFEERIKLTKESIEKELKESDYYTPKNVIINTKYFLEIIEQAERVQELEDIIYRDARQDVLEGLYEENKRYREAIEKAKKELEEDINIIDCARNAHYTISKALESGNGDN